VVKRFVGWAIPQGCPRYGLPQAGFKIGVAPAQALPARHPLAAQALQAKNDPSRCPASQPVSCSSMPNRGESAAAAVATPDGGFSSR